MENIWEIKVVEEFVKCFLVWDIDLDSEDVIDVL